MATISNTPRPGYVFDVTDNVWYPIGTGTHSHSEIASTIVDAKGDIITASAAYTPARLAVGNNGETLVADSSATTGLRWQGDYAAGKNKIINGDFGVWQRGTSFQPNGSSAFYTADRFVYLMDDGTNNKTVSQQTFTPGTAPVSGYEGTYFLRVASTAASTVETYSFLSQYIEDVRTFAGQTITISFWAKAAANTTMPSVAIRQNFGSGGSAAVDTSVTTNIAVTTSWQRFSYSVAVPSVSGKTIGTSSYLRIGLFNPTRATFTLDFWGVQVEGANTATAFQTATGTLQGELAACQRYYFRTSKASGSNVFPYFGQVLSSTRADFTGNSFVSMRVIPTSVDFSNLKIQDAANSQFSFTSLVMDFGNENCWSFNGTLVGATSGRSCRIIHDNSANPSYLGFSAEL